MIAILIVITAVLFLLFFGIRIVRPTERGLIERLGKYHRFAQPGFHLIFPGVERMIEVNITEHMVDSDKREVITKDNLNAIVDSQIYFKVQANEESVKKSVYAVSDFERQIVSLARTTLRNIIGTLTLKDANSGRGTINTNLLSVLHKEAESWGIDIVRAEIKEIAPPPDVQETMNKVVKAENEKIAAIDFATATETRADGDKRAAIKQAEGLKQAQILNAQGQQEAQIAIATGEAESIKLVNEAANKFFTGNAQILRKLQATEKSLEKNTKIIVPAGQSLTNVIGSLTE